MESLDHELNESSNYTDVETSGTNAVSPSWILRLGPYVLFLISGSFVAISYKNPSLAANLQQIITMYIIGIILCIITEIIARNEELYRQKLLITSQYCLSIIVLFSTLNKLERILDCGDLSLQCALILIALEHSSFFFLKFGILRYCGS